MGLCSRGRRSQTAINDGSYKTGYSCHESLPMIADPGPNAPPLYLNLDMGEAGGGSVVEDVRRQVTPNVAT